MFNWNTFKQYFWDWLLNIGFKFILIFIVLVLVSYFGYQKYKDWELKNQPSHYVAQMLRMDYKELQELATDKNQNLCICFLDENILDSYSCSVNNYGSTLLIYYNETKEVVLNEKSKIVKLKSYPKIISITFPEIPFVVNKEKSENDFTMKVVSIRPEQDTVVYDVLVSDGNPTTKSRQN